ncbi:hypothetical protein ASZ90_017017 [hydrocarbon metagenome]|uniref:Uncharacterized protein n=1 Tax=hydrocarbon metagenome TaxID=938273 RepID=A0A0W8EAT8_9ZZZZ
MGRFREAAGEEMGRYLPFCCRLIWVLGGVSPSCTTRMDPTGKNHMIPQDTSIQDENAAGIFIRKR